MKRDKAKKGGAAAAPATPPPPRPPATAAPAPAAPAPNALPPPASPTPTLPPEPPPPRANPTPEIGGVEEVKHVDKDDVGTASPGFTESRVGNLRDFEGDAADGDDEDDAPGDAADRTEARSGSMRVSFREGIGSFFEGIGHGAFHAGLSEGESGEADPTTNAEEYKYPDGFKLVHDGKHVADLVKRLGEGAMGTVYLGRLPDGSLVAVKALRADKAGAERRTMEKQLAVETSIGVAMARHSLIASVVGVVIPLPDVQTTAKGLLLLCDLVDAGDLEEAMSTKAAVAKQKPDYAGTLWNKESAKKWPLPSITLQIFLGFNHVHERGVLHQVCNCETLSFGRSNQDQSIRSSLTPNRISSQRTACCAWTERSRSPTLVRSF